MANPQHKTCLSVLRSVIGSVAGNEARFAEKIGRSTSWLKKASCGQIPLTENIALRIAYETGISVRWLMQGDTSKTPVDKDDKTFTKATYENYRSPDYFPGKDCHCEARSSYECGCDADWTPVEVYKLREDAKQLAVRLTALELESTSELARLEQERDDALSQIAQAECRAERFCQERDIAEDERIDMAQQLESEKECHARCQNERDEAREDLEFRRELYKVQDKYLDDARRERDEARNAIVGWENKWKCAIEMAARAELERDEALKCAKEYYVEFIRNASSDNKVSKPNPLNPFYKLT